VSTVIKLKRGTATPTTSDIVNGEVAIDTSAKKLYINDSGTVKEIGGGGGGSAITIQDEGSSLSTAASTINFVGSGVVASGTGSTKTITISGGSGGGVNVQGEVRAYTGDGSSTGFTVTSGADVENVLVFLNGVYQRPTTDYTVSSTTLTFGTAPVNGESIIIKELVEGKNTFMSSSVVRAFTGDGSTTGFTVSSGKSVSQFLVFLNGVFQRPTTNFSYSGSTLTFGTAPANADVIIVKELAEGTGSSLLTIVDDSSTTTSLDAGESLKITGSGGVTTSLSGDTLTIAGAAQLTVQEEGSDLSTAASTLNFVGSGVTATGSGATKTITIPGGGGDIFKNITMPDGSTVVAADSATDTLTLAETGLVTITGNSSTDTVTFGTASAAQIPFLKADGSSSDIDLQTSGKINEVLTNLHIPFTIADGTDVTTLVVA